ncbi:MAG: hypothetical protein KDB80_14880 [Planctomycetes bacterium]|nr:hypothetical protein [Planctomycetota bacterium]
MSTESMRRGAHRWALASCLAFGFSGCIASNVVAREDRAVVTAADELQWSAEPVDTLDGLFESVDIRGEAAAQLWKIYYWFEQPSRYTAAALTVGPEGPAFQTLDGRWEIVDGGLLLDGGEPAALARAVDEAGVEHVRIETPGGAVVMRRVEVR